jgi:hypothetical protein
VMGLRGDTLIGFATAIPYIREATAGQFGTFSPALVQAGFRPS